MRRTLLLAIASTATAGWAAAPSAAQQDQLVTPATPGAARPLATAAVAFLATLDAARRQAALFPFVPQRAAVPARYSGGPDGRLAFVGERYGEAVWSNFPVSDVPRPGLAMGGLSPVQRRAALAMLEALLSPAGFRKVMDIMDADQVLGDSGTPCAAGTAHYTVGLFGIPGGKGPWMLQFGGHHLGLTAVVSGPHVGLAPVLTGTQPARFVRGRETVRALGAETDRAVALMAALDPAWRRLVALDPPVSDLVLGPGQDGRTLPTAGLAAADMTPEQREMLFALVGEWAGLLNAADAAPVLGRIWAGLDGTRFGFHGQDGTAGPFYFRVTGPAVHIEFAHQQWGRTGGGVQAGGTNHIHTVFRDPGNEYGADWLGGS